jgi:5-methyltetrahydrofolate--homocysteine methyltransferase
MNNRKDLKKMKTTVSSEKKEVFIGDELPTVLIGERINPTGKKKLSAALQAGDLELVRREALSQAKDGADILDVNVGAQGVDEVAMLSDAVQMLAETTEVPLCIDSNLATALEGALKVYNGKALINSVNGEERSLKEILPLVKEYKAAVIGLLAEDSGIPDNADGRLKVADRIINEAVGMGIPIEDIIIDPLAMTLGAESKAGLVTLETIRRIKADFGVNMTLGASNISFGLPDRHLLNSAFLVLAISMGVTCPIVDADKARPIAAATDLALGRDEYAMRFTTVYRERQKS